MNFPRDLGDHAGLANFHIVNVALIYYLTPGYQFQPLLPLSGGAVSWAHYFTVAKFLQQAHARLLTSSQSGSWRTLLHAFWEHPIVAVQPVHPHDLTETLRPLMEAHASWDAYVDGSWYPLASTAESLLGEAASHTGGFSIILVPSNTDLLSGVIALRVDARDLTRIHGGSPRMMELIGITSSFILLHSLGKGGRIYTDNQSITKQLRDSRRMRRTGLMGGSSFSIRGWEILQEGHISLHGGIPSAAKRTAHSGPVRIGVYLANLLAPPRASLPSPGRLAIHPDPPDHPHGHRRNQTTTRPLRTLVLSRSL